MPLILALIGVVLDVPRELVGGLLAFFLIKELAGYETCRKNFGGGDGDDIIYGHGRGSPKIHHAATVASTVLAPAENPAQRIFPASTLPPEAALHAPRAALNQGHSRRQTQKFRTATGAPQIIYTKE